MISTEQGVAFTVRRAGVSFDFASTSLRTVCFLTVARHDVCVSGKRERVGGMDELECVNRRAVARREHER